MGGSRSSSNEPVCHLYKLTHNIEIQVDKYYYHQNQRWLGDLIHNGFLRSLPMIVVVIAIIAFVLPNTYNVQLGNEEAPVTQAQRSMAILNINKNETYETIQGAIEEANYGDTIRLFAGEYNETVSLYNGVNLLGSGAGKTVINSPSYAWGVYIFGNDCVMEGITVNGGYTSWGYCVYVTGDDVKIRNCELLGGSIGIVVEDSTYNNVYSGNTFKNMSQGIFFYYTDGSEINNNTFYCEQDAVYVGYSSNIKFKDNELIDCYINIEYYAFGLDTLSFEGGNTVNGKPIVYINERSEYYPTEDFGQLIVYGCNNITIRNASGDPPPKLDLFSSWNNTVTNCTLQMEMFNSDNNRITECDFISAEGVQMISSSYNSFSGCTFTGGFYGVDQDTCYYNDFDSNIIYDNYYGIVLSYSADCTMSNNTFYNNSGVDVQISAGQSHFLKDNKFYSNSTGIHVYDLSMIEDLKGYHTIVNNHFVDMVRAIRVSYSRNLFISGNRMEGCGITLFGTDTTEWTSHTIDTSNTVDGRPVHYITTETNPEIPDNPGQLLLADCSEVRVSDLKFTSTSVGVVLGYCRDVEIFKVTIKDNYIGILAAWSDDIIISEMTCAKTYTGAYLAGCTGVTVTQSTFMDSEYGGIVLDGSSQCFIRNNKLNNDSISLYTSSYTNVTGNTLEYGEVGIQLYSSYHNNITENHCKGHDRGIGLSDSMDCFIRSNTVMSGTNGISLEHSSSNTIQMNVFDSNSVGLNLWYSDLVEVDDNKMEGNHYGMMVNSSEGVFIRNNTIRSSIGSGMTLDRSGNCEMINNLFQENGEYGLSLDPEGPFIGSGMYGWGRFTNSTNNRIYFNRFEDNNHGGVQAKDNGYKNLWNKFVGGNYWSDWLSPDSDNDGFVDDPYPLDGNSTSYDSLPLTDIPMGDTDGDGYYDHTEERYGTDINDNSSKPPDKDKDLIPNDVDPDIDGDGELNENDPDMDGDGFPNDNDQFPKDPDRWEEEGEEWSAPLVAIIIASSLVVVAVVLVIILLLIRKRNQGKVVTDMGAEDDTIEEFTDRPSPEQDGDEKEAPDKDG